MADISAGLSYIAEIGLDAIKERIKAKKDEDQARARLTDYLNRQQEYNFDCSLEEEIDFEGLAEYIRGDLMNDVNKCLFGSAEERDAARQTIADKAASYAQAKTKLSQERARHLAVTAVDILSRFYRSGVGRDLLLAAAEIEDTIVSEMTNQHQALEKKIDALTGKVENSGLLSIDRNVMLANEGHMDMVERNFSSTIKALSAVHSLAPYYGFAMDGQEYLKSIPLRQDATQLYPPHFDFTAKAFKMGDAPLMSLDSNALLQAYRSQTPIEFDIITAKKYLGDTLDPMQHEAEKLSGAHVVMKPPSFPEAFPCSVIIDENTEVDYLLLRTKRIEEDGTAVVTNDEQENFSFRVTLRVNLSSNSLNLTVMPVNPTNAGLLKYRQFLKKAISAKKVSLKALKQNVIIISSKASLKPHDCENLESEIEFLQKIVAIENYFQVTFTIPEEITIEDHRLIDRLYAMIIDGEYRGTCKRFTMSFEMSHEFRDSVCNLGDKPCGLAYAENVEAELFGQEFHFQILRKIDCIRLENWEKTKAKIDVLDDGDVLKLAFISGETDSDAHYSDVFYSEDAEKQLFCSPESED